MIRAVRAGHALPSCNLAGNPQSSHPMLTDLVKRLLSPAAKVPHTQRTPEIACSFSPLIVPDPDWQDPWFDAHFHGVATRICTDNMLPDYRKDATILDFGCGDGINSAGVATRTAASVIGVDITRAFDTLHDTLRQKHIGHPPNLSFVQSRPGGPLPFPDDHFDLVCSWSVFEHVTDVSSVLVDLLRVTRPGGALYVQIEPLFHGPYGSHLRRLVDQPWAHLLMDEETFLDMARSAHDNVAAPEQDILYRNNEFERVKNYLLGEYRSLNRITAEELLQAIADAGFSIESGIIIKVGNLTPPQRLVEQYGSELLLTNEILVCARKR